MFFGIFDQTFKFATNSYGVVELLYSREKKYDTSFCSGSFKHLKYHRSADLVLIRYETVVILQ